MQYRRLILIFIVVLLLNAVMAQSPDTIPLLKGTVNISVTKGTMECDFVLKNMPNIRNNYVIRINSGMNVRSFKDVKHGNLIYFNKDLKDTLSSGESSAYYFPDNEHKGRFLPDELELRYSGMYPVVTDSLSGYMAEDWRGDVAFNGSSVRADGLQSAWYPVLFDPLKQKEYEQVKYDIHVNCQDCNTLYVNGSMPLAGTSANFKSDIPRELLLYCGNFKTADIGGTRLLNPDMDAVKQQQFAGIINTYKAYYEKNLGIPYGNGLVFIQTTPTSQNNAFLFVAYPTIINIGKGKYGLNAMFNKEQADSNKPYIAHELGHYYFGTVLRINSEFGPVIDEGFAEFLSFKVTKNLIADTLYKNKIKGKINDLKGFKAVPLSVVRIKNDFNDRELYVYYYVPILLTAIEKEIGEKAMWNWMKAMLNTKTDFTDYAFFVKTFESALNNKAKAGIIENKYFTSANALYKVH